MRISYQTAGNSKLFHFFCLLVYRNMSVYLPVCLDFEIHYNSKFSWKNCLITKFMESIPSLKKGHTYLQNHVKVQMLFCLLEKWPRPALPKILVVLIVIRLSSPVPQYEFYYSQICSICSCTCMFICLPCQKRNITRKPMTMS